MRYKREIAYVIIVCTRTDDLSYDLITSLNAPDLLDVEGFIDGKGRIKDIRHFPSFTTCYYNQSASHETLSFAFYFPKKQNFKCQVDNVKEVEHTGCIHRREMHYYYDRDTGEFKSNHLCPDEITDKDREKHEKALYWYKYHQNMWTDMEYFFVINIVYINFPPYVSIYLVLSIVLNWHVVLDQVMSLLSTHFSWIYMHNYLQINHLHTVQYKPHWVLVSGQ